MSAKMGTCKSCLGWRLILEANNLCHGCDRWTETKIARIATLERELAEAREAARINADKVHYVKELMRMDQRHLDYGIPMNDREMAHIALCQTWKELIDAGFTYGGDGWSWKAELERLRATVSKLREIERLARRVMAGLQIEGARILPYFLQSQSDNDGQRLRVALGMTPAAESARKGKA